jgi:hypothetical protein
VEDDLTELARPTPSALSQLLVQLLGLQFGLMGVILVAARISPPMAVAGALLAITGIALGVVGVLRRP